MWHARHRARVLLKELEDPTSTWTSGVVRNDPEKYQKQSIQLTWRCPQCREWTQNGAWRARRCNWCWTPRPADWPGLPDDPAALESAAIFPTMRIV
jgi:hypothetical protein